MFFLRFWRQSHDQLFFKFACAFGLLAISYAVVGMLPFASDWRVQLASGSSRSA
jgi:hypothetical protein